MSPSIFKQTGNFITFGFSKQQIVPAEDILKQAEALRASGNNSIRSKYVQGDVYSRYPLNLKDELLVDVGAGAGVRTGGAAIFNGMLVGRIKESGENLSIVQTVFDPNFSLPVRIGKNKVDALLKGGVEPKLTLIQKNSDISQDDMVYSASSELEYGLAIGEAGPATVSNAGVFAEAPLKLSYSPADLRAIFLEAK